MKKVFIFLIAITFVASLSTASWAITFVQDTGFDTGSLVSSDAGTPSNDTLWNTTIPAVPGDLPGGTSIVSPTSPYFNTISWGGASLPGSNDNGGLTATDNWGDSNYSALRVLGFSGDIVENNWTTISRIYHQNNAISSDFHTLVSATITSALTIGTTDINNLDFTFAETLNEAPCANPLGDDCADVFTFNAADFAPVFFSVDGVNYEAEFRLANLLNSEQDASGFPLLSLWTAEGVTSSADVELRLNAVPEPMSMLLFSTGLAGAALRRRFIG